MLTRCIKISNTLTTVHSLNVHFELLWLTKLSTAKVTEWSRTLRISTATICPMHLKIIETKEELFAVLTLICTFTVMQLLCMLHDIFFAKYGYAAYFTMVFSYCQTEAWIVEHGTMRTIMEWVVKAKVATATAYE